MKFKAEMCLLLMALMLFVVSAFFYSWPAISFGSYPYRLYALMFVGFGSALTLVASVSYSKRSKITFSASELPSLAEDKAH